MYIGTLSYKCQQNAEWGGCWNNMNSYCLCIPLFCALVMFKESCIYHDCYFGKEAEPQREISEHFVMRSSFLYTSTLTISLLGLIVCVSSSVSYGIYLFFSPLSCIILVLFHSFLTNYLIQVMFVCIVLSSVTLSSSFHSCVYNTAISSVLSLQFWQVCLYSFICSECILLKASWVEFICPILLDTFESLSGLIKLLLLTHEATAARISQDQALILALHFWC